MRRAIIPALTLLALAAAPGAQGAVIELGGVTPFAAPSCPKTATAECQAVGRVSGYMGRIGARANPYVVPRDGKLVAFTIALSRPTADERRFFTDLYGGPPQARISVLRQATRGDRRVHRLLRQSVRYRVDPYFGSSPTFVFDRPIPVSARNIVALTVPTWTPSLAVGLGRDNWWRSSRLAGRCSNVGQMAAQQFQGSLRQYGCNYFTARLTYTVSYVPNPRRTDGR